MVAERRLTLPREGGRPEPPRADAAGAIDAPRSDVAFRLRVPRDSRYQPEGAVAALLALHQLGLPAAFELSGHGAGAEVTVRTANRQAAGLLRQQLLGAYPGCSFQEVVGDLPTPPAAVHTEFGMRRHPAVPLPALGGAGRKREDPAPFDAVGGLLSALDEVRQGECVRFRLLLTGRAARDIHAWAERWLADVHKNRGRPVGGGPLGLFARTPGPLEIGALDRVVEAVERKAASPLFTASVRLLVASSTRDRTVQLLRDALAPLAAGGASELNALVPLPEGGRTADGKRVSFHPVVLSPTEALSLWHLPVSGEGAGRGAVIRGVDLPVTLEPREGAQIGWTSAGSDGRPVRIPTDDLRRHLVCVGASGGGKSTTLITLASSLVESGQGCGIIDVKGDLADDFLGRVPANRRGEVVVIDPTDPEGGWGIDLFAVARQLDRDLAADFVVSAFQAQFAESWGVAFPRPMRAAVRALLDVPGATLLDLPRFLRDRDLRDRMLEEVQDASVRDYFAYEFEPQGRSRQLQAIAPVLTRVGAALESAFGRRVFGQAHGADLRTVMDRKGILVCRYHGGLIGKQNASLFAGLTAAACQLAAMTRVELPERERHNWLLICDEAHDYATAGFAETLSLGRGYGFSLVLATQFLGQMPAQVRSSMLSNASTLVSFRLGEEDVSLVGRRYEPYISRHELTELSNYVAVVRTSVHGERQPPYTLHVRPPATPWRAEVAQEVREHSRRAVPAATKPVALAEVAKRRQPAVRAPHRVRWDDIEEQEA